jgi:hypothetical protein
VFMSPLRQSGRISRAEVFHGPGRNAALPQLWYESRCCLAFRAGVPPGAFGDRVELLARAGGLSLCPRRDSGARPGALALTGLAIRFSRFSRGGTEHGRVMSIRRIPAISTGITSLSMPGTFSTVPAARPATSAKACERCGTGRPSNTADCCECPEPMPCRRLIPDYSVPKRT